MRNPKSNFPARHSTFVKQTKNFARGFSKALHNGSTTIKYWNDNNSARFIDNNAKWNREGWELFE